MAEKAPDKRYQKTETTCYEVIAIRTDGKWFKVNDMYFETPLGCEVTIGDKVILEAITRYELKAIIGSYEKWYLGEEGDG